MNLRFTGLVCALGAGLWAQTPPPPQPEPKKEIPPDTVVAIVGDHKLTSDGGQQLVAGVPPPYQQASPPARTEEGDSTGYGRGHRRRSQAHRERREADCCGSASSVSAGVPHRAG